MHLADAALGEAALSEGTTGEGAIAPSRAYSTAAATATTTGTVAATLRQMCLLSELIRTSAGNVLTEGFVLNTHKVAEGVTQKCLLT